MKSRLRPDAIPLLTRTIGLWRQGTNWAYPLILYTIGFIAFFRKQIFSNFDLMFGDSSDGRFVVFIHEHVLTSISGQSDLLSPPLFFNEPNVLGYSEAFLLDQIVYAPSRLLGKRCFDPSFPAMA
jgi:hypothetical protein